MPRPGAPLLVLAIGGVFLAAALLGRAAAPRGASQDPRLSTRLSTIDGARGFRTALERFGIEVTERRRPLFDLGRAERPDSQVLFAILKPAAALTMPERREARDWVARGGRLLLAGVTGVERCFGYQVVPTDTLARNPWRVDDGRRYRSDAIPAPRAVLHHASRREKRPPSQFQPEQCELYQPSRIEALWVGGRDTSALLLRFRSGGSAIVVADASVFSNRVLRRSDAGVMVFGWIFAQRPRAIMIDEYHQGFGASGSLTGAVMARTWRSPAGWMVIQLVAAGVLGLLLAAVRFGPALAAPGRRRRSPLEHLDALAAGLERSGAHATGVRLIVSGLRRRLAGSAARPARDAIAWLDALEAGARSPESRAAIARLRQLSAPPASGTAVLSAANAVEDVWTTLKVPAPRRS